MRQPVGSHFVLIPSYNTGAKVFETVREARRYWDPVWVVVDGSTDGTAEALQASRSEDAGLRVLVLPRNRAKAPRCSTGCGRPRRPGYTHVLTMDADGQHPADLIPDFMACFARTTPTRWCWACRSSTPSAPRPPARAQDLQLAGQLGDAVGRHRRRAVRLPRLSDRAIA